MYVVHQSMMHQKSIVIESCSPTCHQDSICPATRERSVFVYLLRSLKLSTGEISRTSEPKTQGPSFDWTPMQRARILSRAGLRAGHPTSGHRLQLARERGWRS